MHSTCQSMTVLLMACAAMSASAQVDEDRLRRMPIAELERVYLSCEEASARDRLDHGSVVVCSIVYEELKRQAFDNDFDKILAWSRTQAKNRESAAVAR